MTHVLNYSNHAFSHVFGHVFSPSVFLMFDMTSRRLDMTYVKNAETVVIHFHLW